MKFFRRIPTMRHRAAVLRRSACYQVRFGYGRHLVDDVPSFAAANAEEKAAWTAAAAAQAPPIDPVGRMDACSMKRFRRAMEE